MIMSSDRDIIAKTESLIDIRSYLYKFQSINTEFYEKLLLEYKKYITPKKTTNTHPCKRTEKARYTTILVVIIPIASHGLYLPHLVLVLSMMFPIIGSFSASKTLAATMIMVMAISCAAVS